MGAVHGLVRITGEPFLAKNDKMIKLIFGIVKREVLNSQEIRKAAIASMSEILEMAKTFSKDTNLTPPVRIKWSKVALYAGQVITGMLASYDDKQIDHDLGVLEGLINEAKTTSEAERTHSKMESSAPATDTDGQD